MSVPVTLSDRDRQDARDHRFVQISINTVWHTMTKFGMVTRARGIFPGAGAPHSKGRPSIRRGAQQPEIFLGPLINAHIIWSRATKFGSRHLNTRAALKLWGAVGQYQIPVGKIGDFRRKSPFIPETVRDRPGNNPKHFFHSFHETDYSYSYTFL